MAKTYTAQLIVDEKFHNQQQFSSVEDAWNFLQENYSIENTVRVVNENGTAIRNPANPRKGDIKAYTKVYLK